MPLTAINSYIAFLATDLTNGNVNARTKNIRTRRRLSLIRAWTRLIMTMASSTNL
jgi:hypothetical protein